MKEDLKQLIDAILQDGVVTEKERSVLRKKAIALGENPDEIDILLDAELQKQEQEADAILRKRKSKTCPYCGGGIPELAEECPHCHEKLSAAVSEELHNILEHLEEALIQLKKGKDIAQNKALVEAYSRKARAHYSKNPKVQNLLQEIDAEVQKTTQNFEKTARNEKVNTVFKYIFVTNRKLILAAIIVAVALVAGKFLYETLNPDIRGQINQAINSGNTEKAVEIFTTSEFPQNEREQVICDIVRSYMKNEDLENTEAFFQTLGENNVPQQANRIYRDYRIQKYEKDINLAINDDDMKTAYILLTQFREDFSELTSLDAGMNLIKEFVKREWFNEAIDLARHYTLVAETKHYMQEALTKNHLYEEAFEFIEVYDLERFEAYLKSAVLYMKEQGQIAQAETFIDQKLRYYHDNIGGKEKKMALRNQLLEILHE